MIESMNWILYPNPIYEFDVYMIKVVEIGYVIALLTILWWWLVVYWIIVSKWGWESCWSQLKNTLWSWTHHFKNGGL